jgi:putative flippase GtrA
MINPQFLKFILVGGLNTLFGYGLFALLLALGLPYPYALFLATCIGVLFNFKSTGKLVFKNSSNALLIRFILLYVFIYLFNLAAIKIFNIFLDNLYWSGMIAMLPSALLSYYFSKKYVFVSKTSKT